MKYAQILNNKVHCIFEDDLTLEELGQQKYNLNQITLVDITNATDVKEGYDYVNGVFSNIDLIYGKIGTSQYKIKRISDAYTPASDEVLMSALPTTTADVAKETGTWITPAQDYFVYKNVNNVCILNRDASYLVIEKKYKNDLVNLLIAKEGAEASLKEGTLTEAECTANLATMEATRTAIFASTDAMKGVVDDDNALS